ncbi:MAG: hypothetical protein V1704_05040, partial [Candidatus Vogelbacteria bacterium]
MKNFYRFFLLIIIAISFSLIPAWSVWAEPPSALLLGTKKVAVILFSFSDFKNDQQWSPAEAMDLRRKVFTDPDSVATYYRENSFGRLNLTGDVFGPYLLDRSLKYFTGSNLPKLKEALLGAATKNNENITGYDYYVFYHRSIFTADYEGMFIDSDTHNAVIINGFRNPNPWIIGHELGHAFSLGHANVQSCHDRNYHNGALDQPGFVCNVDNYADPFSIMGKSLLLSLDTGFGIPHLNNFSKVKLGWFDLSKTATISKDGFYQLAPANKPPASADPILLRIPIKDSRYDVSHHDSLYYYLEYRAPASGRFEKFSSSDPAVNGISVRVAGGYYSLEDIKGGETYLLDVTPSDSPDYKDAFILSGQTFEDAPRGIKIKVLSVDGARAQLEITVDERRYVKITWPFNAAPIKKTSQVSFSWQRNNLPDNLTTTLSLKNTNGSVPWTITTPNDGDETVDLSRVPDGQYKLTIAVNYEGTVYRDESVQFELQDTLPSLTLLTPQSEAVLQIGQPLFVSWLAQDIPAGTNLTINLFNNQNQLIRTEQILVSTDNRLFGLPATIPSGQYKIKIFATVSGQQLFDIVDDVFLFSDFQSNLWISDNPSFSVTPTSVPAGGTVTSSDIKVMNDGDAPSGGFNLGLYLSTDSTITTSDTLLLLTGRPSIATGSFSNTGTFTLA